MATPTEPMTAHLHTLNPQRQVDFSQLSHLPNSHAWPKLNDHPLNLSSKDTGEPVPIINLSNSNVLSELADACRRWGVFTVTGHGVPRRTLLKLESQSLLLFSLPAAQKLKAERAPNGLSGYGQARISYFFPKLMWSEGFTIASSPEEHARMLWPNGRHLPFCEAYEEYNQEMKKLAGRLLTLILKSIKLPLDGVSWYDSSSPVGSGFSAARSLLQLNYYPPCTSPDRAMGLAQHTDSSLFTILHQNLVSGLQVLSPGDERWVTVPCVEEGLIVNIGDLLHVISNGRFASVVHRAVVDRDLQRLSIAFIYGPPAEEKMGPICRGLERPVYRPVSWPEYIGIKGKHFSNALDFIRIPSSGQSEEAQEDE